MFKTKYSELVNEPAFMFFRLVLVEEGFIVSDNNPYYFVREGASITLLETEIKVIVNNPKFDPLEYRIDPTLPDFIAFLRLI